jgi:hypothetical protein
LISWETPDVLRQSGWQQSWEMVRCQSEKASLFGGNGVITGKGSVGAGEACDLLIFSLKT